MLANVPSFRSLFDESPAFWGYLDWVITCTIILPFGLFLYQIVGESLRRFLRWLLAAQAVFAVFGILAVAFGAGLRKLFVANNVLVLGTFVALPLFLVATAASRPAHRLNPRNPRLYRRFCRLDSVHRARKSRGA